MSLEDSHPNKAIAVSLHLREAARVFTPVRTGLGLKISVSKLYIVKSSFYTSYIIPTSMSLECGIWKFWVVDRLTALRAA